MSSHREAPCAAVVMDIWQGRGPLLTPVPVPEAAVHSYVRIQS
jgi:hypothetical protein